MIIQHLVQGSDAWHDFRNEHDTASEAPIMMGASKNATRNELLKEKATGSYKEFSAWLQKNVLDKGHEVEALARPIIEAQLGEDLYPVTAKSEEYDNLAASFDGCTLLDNVIWECKQWNQSKADSVKAGVVPEQDRWQVVQQLVVSRADKCLYTVTDGTPENTVSCEYVLQQGDEDSLLAGWAQFNVDRAAFEWTPEKVEAVGEAPESLPSLRINLTGMVTASNLDDFKQQAVARIESIKTNLATDQDFADAEKTVKYLREGEKQLDDAKAKALADTVSIDELFRTVDELKEQMRQKRLQLDKLVKAEKENRRMEIHQKASESFDVFLQELDCPVEPNHTLNIAGVMKGKRTIETLQSAADDEVARAKIECTQAAKIIKANHDLLSGQEQAFLFSDWQQLVLKAPDDLQAIITARIAEHKQREEAKLEQERLRIQQEEQAKAEAEARAKAQEEFKAEMLEEAKRKAQEQMPNPEPEPAPDIAAQQLAPSTFTGGGVTGGVIAASQLQQPEQVTISKAEYKQLKEAAAMLDALIAAGVDNWTGYDDAMRQLAV